MAEQGACQPRLLADPTLRRRRRAIRKSRSGIATSRADLLRGLELPTLSGGEAQREKLVAELAKVRPESLRARPSAPTR